jgi:hypothetical protein
MKKLLLFAAVMAFSFTRLSAQAPPEIIHYNFNSTGSLVPNMASSPPPGTATGTILAGLDQGVAVGQCSAALSGSGTSSSSNYLNSGWTTSLTGSWSIAFWTNSITPSSTLWYIFGDASAGSFRCFTNGVASANNWLLRATGMTDMLITGGATTTAAHNCFVYDAANGQGRRYLNGVLQGTVAQSASASFVGSGPFKVGGYASNSNLNGLMDEFRIYSRALTNSEVASLAQGAAVSNTVTVTACGSYTSPISSIVYTTSGAFTETYAATCGGTSTNNLNLTINPIPTLTITASSSNVCSGTTVNLTTTGNITTYTWNNTGPNTSSISVVPASTTVYSLLATNSTSCPVSRTIAINVTATPTLVLQPAQAGICSGTSVTINASGAPTYTWNTGSNDFSITVSPPVTTVYTVTASSSTCMTTRTVEVQVTPTPTVVVSAPAYTICNGSPLTMTVSGAASYGWSTGATGSMITASPATATNYVVYGISNGCVDTKTITVAVDPTPTVSLVSSVSSVCSGTMVTLTATGATTYSWSSGGTSNPTTVTPLVTSVYTVTGTTGNCSKNATISISAIPGPSVTVVASSTAACLGSPVFLTANGAFSYTWSNAMTGAGITVTPAVTTTYVATGSAQNGCLGASSIVIPVHQLPNVTLGSSSPVICKGETATLTATGGTSYLWSLSTSTAGIITVTPSTTRVYSVTGTDANGCKATAVITQTVSDCLGLGIGNMLGEVNVYPNPGSGLYTISSPYNEVSVSVYNNLGQIILQVEHIDKQSEIDLRKMDNGIYYLHVKSGVAQKTICLIKE